MQEYQYPFPFKLENGYHLEQVRIGYHCYGSLNENKDNVIWVCHALTANSNVTDWWSGLFGEGKLFDPKNHFIICANNLGSPYGSTCPNDINSSTRERYGMSFPNYTIRDSANFLLLLKEHLGIKNIKTLIGGSCGGNIALEMAYTLQEEVENLILLCNTHKETPWNIAIHQAQRLAIEADQEFKINRIDAAKAGLKAARAMALVGYRTFWSFNKTQAETSEEITSDFKASSYINYQGQKLVDRFDAHSYYKLLNALDTHNISRNRGTAKESLKKIISNTTIIGIKSDFLIPISEQKFLHDHIPYSKFFQIESDYGHDGFLLEFDQIQNIIENQTKIKSYPKAS